MSADVPYESIIFDFDGTLADTFEAAKRLFNELAIEHGYNPVKEEEIPMLRHLSALDFFKHHGIGRLQIPFLLPKGVKRLRNEMEKLFPIAGIADVLPVLYDRKIMLGILTSNSVENVRAFLSFHQLEEYFSFVSSTSKLTGKAKHLRSISRSFSLDIKKILYIGDETRDIKAAQKAGVDIAAVTWGFNSSESLSDLDPTHIIDHPNKILNLVNL